MALSGPSGLYELFFLAASAVVVLLTLAAHVLGRQLGHARALGGTLSLVGVFTAVGAVGGLTTEAAIISILLGGAFLYVPVAVGGAVAHLVTESPPNDIARVFPGAWMAALLVALLTQAAGAKLGTVLAGTPGLLGVDWYLGFMVYTICIGLVSGAACVPLLTASGEGTGFFEGLGT
ncbi:MAG: hypothetical protein ABEI99_06490 [Halobaculum sp.]